MDCPDPATLERYALRDAGGDAALESHVDRCSECAGLVAELRRLFAGSVASSSSGGSLAYARTVASGEAQPLSTPESIGRYRVLHPIGAGGMGVVLAAHDPQLDRTVALKILARDPAIDSAREHVRLAREARAMARLAHPDVVTVFDVGVDEASGRLFLAMELVRGTTLSAWLKQRPRREDEILTAFVAAGEGLAAAHAAGLVHRDFKPDNVLVGDDGRVRVGDFGLALDAAPDPSAIALAEADAAHTRRGAIVGTPVYMAPEQLLGREADARTDQFAFAVALHEALHGARPFEGRSFSELRENVLAGRSPRAAFRVGPRWQRSFFSIALSPAPERRFPDMAAALAALRTAARPPARRAWLVAGALALVALGGAAAIAVIGASARSPVGSVAGRGDDGDGPVPGGEVPPAVRDEVAATRRELAAVEEAARGFLTLKEQEGLRARAESALVRARTVGFDPLLAEALVARAHVDVALERPARAQVALEEAVRTARAARYDALVLDATIDLIDVAGAGQGPTPQVETWIGVADAEARRAARPEQRARLALAVARVRLAQGRAEEALARLDVARELRVDAGGGRALVPVLRERARALRAVGRKADALDEAARAVKLVDDDVVLRGSDEAARAAWMHGLCLLDLGRTDDAAATLEAAAAEATLRRANATALLVHDALAQVATARGDAALAQTELALALGGLLEEDDRGKLAFHDPTGAPRSAGAIDFAQRVRGRVEGPDDPHAITEANALAARVAVEGDEPRALRELGDVLARAEDNPVLVYGAQGAIHHNRALLALRAGDLASARDEVSAALAALGREVGVDHARYGRALALEARVLDRLGSPSAGERRDQARALLARRSARP